MEELDLKELLTCVWRKKISIIVIVAISIIIGCIYTNNYTTPLYRSSATIILGKISSTVTGKTLDENITISESDLALNSNLILTYSELIKSRSVMQEVKNNLDSDISVEGLVGSVSVARVNNSDLLSISASNANPELAKDIVTEVVKIFSENVKEIYKIDNVFVIDTPTISTAPYNINHAKDVGIFACVGIFVAFAYVFLYTFLDNTVKSATDIENFLGIKTLITIPFDKKKKEELVTAKESKAIISEAFRTLRTNVQFSTVDTKGSQSLLITSCLPSEGKSYVSANLAIAFAQAGKKVILVDSDMRRGRQARMFNVPNKNGLSNYISNIDSNGMEINWNLGEYIKKTGIDNLDLITAGSVPPNPAELLESARLAELVEELKRYYNVVIFDGAPILPITDSLLLGRVLGKTMLVAVHNKTKKDNLVKAKASIEDVGGKIIGIALNKVSMNANEYSNNYYYYAEDDRELTLKEKIAKNIKEKAKVVEEWFKSLLTKIKTTKKRLTEGKTPEQKEIEEKKKIEKAEEKAKVVEEKAKQAEEKAKQAAIVAEEKAKKEAELTKIREEERARKAAEKARIAEEKAQKDAELAKIREEERIKKEEEKAKEDAIMAEEKAKRDAELAKQKEEEMAIKAELKKKKEQENSIKKKEKLEQKAQKKIEWESKVNRFKGKALAKKDEIGEELKAKKEEYTQKYNEYKAIKAEENKEKLEAKAKRDAEIAQIREEERIKREEQRRIQAEEKAKKDAEIAQIREEERIKREEERKLQAEEKAKKDVELARIREEEKIKREEERRIQAEEKAKQAAIAAEEKAKKEAELARIREEEKIRKEEEKAKLAEEKAKKEAEAKLTDEYLEENLYPKTKYNKF